MDKTIKKSVNDYPSPEEQIRMLNILKGLFPGFNPKKRDTSTVRVGSWHRDGNRIWHFKMEKGAECVESMIEADYYSKFWKVEKRYSVEIDDSGKVISIEEQKIKD